MKFPREEMFGLTSQMRRAAVSIPANIAEGCERNSTKEFIQFLGFARGSAAELETHLILAARFGYLAEIQANPLADEIKRVRMMLSALIRSLKDRE